MSSATLSWSITPKTSVAVRALLLVGTGIWVGAILTVLLVTFAYAGMTIASDEVSWSYWAAMFFAPLIVYLPVMYLLVWERRRQARERETTDDTVDDFESMQGWKVTFQWPLVIPVSLAFFILFAVVQRYYVGLVWVGLAYVFLVLTGGTIQGVGYYLLSSEGEIDPESGEVIVHRYRLLSPTPDPERWDFHIDDVARARRYSVGGYTIVRLSGTKKTGDRPHPRLLVLPTAVITEATRIVEGGMEAGATP